MRPDLFSADDLILVTGASSGIGRAIAISLLEHGARVIGVARSEDRLSELAVRFGGRFTYFAADLSQKPEACGALVNEIVQKSGPLSGFVHAAGTLNPQPLSVMALDDVTAEFNTNLFSALFLTKAIAARKHRQARVSLLYISSIAAAVGKPGASCYAMTKAALNSLVTSLAQEVGEKNMRINAIAPGTCDTPMTAAYKDTLPYDYLEHVKSRNLHRDIMKPEDVAELALFLLSEKSRWIHGQCIAIDGGESLA